MVKDYIEESGDKQHKCSQSKCHCFSPSDSSDDEPDSRHANLCGVLKEIEEDVKSRTKGELGAVKTLCSPLDQPNMPLGCIWSIWKCVCPATSTNICSPSCCCLWCLSSCIHSSVPFPGPHLRGWNNKICCTFGSGSSRYPPDYYVPNGPNVGDEINNSIVFRDAGRSV